MVAGDPDKHGLLVITDRQLVFLSKTPLSAWHIYQCPYRHIDRLDHSKGMIFGSISIWVDGLINVNYSCRPTTITFASSPPVGSCQLRSADGLGLL